MKPSKIKLIKSDPISPCLDNSSVYKYGELLLVIWTSIKTQSFQFKCNIAKRFIIAFVNSQLY